MVPTAQSKDSKKVGALLLHEFGVPDEFAVYIDEVRLTPDILEGTKVQLDLQVGGGPGGNDVARVEGAAWLLDKPREVADTESLCA